MAASHKVLFLTPQLPYPPHQGTTIRNYNLIKELAQRHEIHLFSFAATRDVSEQVAHLGAFCASVHTVVAPERSLCQRAMATLLARRPDMGLRLESFAFHERLGRLLEAQRFDIVEVEGMEMAPYLFQAAARPAPRPLLVLDEHNAEYVLQRRAFETDARKPGRWLGAAYSFVQWRKLQGYERAACRRADRVVAVSAADAEALQRLWPGLAVAVVPNGVDLAYWRPDRLYEPLDHSPALVFTAKMDYRPNVDAVLWFVEQVLPIIQEGLPAPAHFYVVGQSPHRRLLPLARDPHITLTGYVPDVRPYVAGADVYVVPLRIGGGTRLKVLEAMAMGKAIVSTALGCEGVGLRDGEEGLLGDTPAAFAACVLRLLGDAGLRRALGERARRFVSSRYDWRVIVPLLERVYERSA